MSMLPVPQSHTTHLLLVVLVVVVRYAFFIDPVLKRDVWLSEATSSSR